jgi:hypothetical protein
MMVLVVISSSARIEAVVCFQPLASRSCQSDQPVRTAVRFPYETAKVAPVILPDQCDFWFGLRLLLAFLSEDVAAALILDELWP